MLSIKLLQIFSLVLTYFICYCFSFLFFLIQLIKYILTHFIYPLNPLVFMAKFIVNYAFSQSNAPVKHFESQYETFLCR